MTVATQAGDTTGAAAVIYDVQRVRQDFPILHQQINGHPLAYLDNAATTQKPQCVIDAVSDFYRLDNANIHRGVHELSVRSTERYEGARNTVRRFINAAATEEIVFVRGTTEAINLVAQSYGRPQLQPGDEIIVTTMEHHSNIVPWQMLCEQTGAVLKVVPINDAGELCMDAFDALLGPRTRIVSVVHVSNALGTINPVKEIVQRAHAQGAVVMIDGAQAVPHMAVDVRDLGCDFYAFSAHKMFGPTGIGVLYGRRERLENLQPYQGGGDMIASVSFDGTTYNDLPYRLEAGTPNIAGAVGLGTTIDYLNALGLDHIAAHEADLLDYATTAIAALPGIRIIGTAAHKTSVVSFVLDDIHPHDVGTIIDQYGVALRTGHHCAQPVMEHYGIAATARISIALYNNRADIDAVVAGLEQVRKVFA